MCSHCWAPGTNVGKQIVTLQDEAASVRQAAVDLLGSHIGTRRDLALAYFETLVTASRDTSTSVRSLCAHM